MPDQPKPVTPEEYDARRRRAQRATKLRKEAGITFVQISGRRVPLSQLRPDVREKEIDRLTRLPEPKPAEPAKLLPATSATTHLAQLVADSLDEKKRPTPAARKATPAKATKKAKKKKAGK